MAGVITLQHHSYFNLRKLQVRAEHVAVTDVPLNEGDQKFETSIVLTEKFTQVPKWGGSLSKGHNSYFIVAGYKITPNCRYHD